MKFIRVAITYYKRLIVKSKLWLFFTASLVLGGILTGLVISLFFPEQGAKLLQEYAKSLDSNLSPGLFSALYILQRNLLVSLISIFSGLVFGLVPAFIAYTNGLFLGSLLGLKQVYLVLNPWQLFLLLAPHGFVEYTATILAWGFGIRLGINWLLPVSSGQRFKVFRTNFLEACTIFFLALILLIIAALIEGILTERIACFLGGVCR